ncbi:MAG TPA: ribonuclease III domain-containing protein [Allocoleopsis sp.]
MNNIHNILISKEEAEYIINENLYDKSYFVKINDIQKFQKAFIQQSFCTFNNDNEVSDQCCVTNIPKYRLESNERIEFLGDRILEFITSEFLFDKLQELPPGKLTKLKSRIVQKKSFGSLAIKCGFDKFLLISCHVERTDGRKNIRLYEDAFESFIGALYMDQHRDIGICRNFILGVYSRYIDLGNLINTNENFIDAIQRYFHSKKWGNPVYNCVYIKNADKPKKKFVMCLLISKDLFYSKKIEEKILGEILHLIPENELNEVKNVLQNENKTILGYGIEDSKKEASQICAEYSMISLDIPLDY